MSYTIDVQRENGIFISEFGPEMLRGDELDRYLQEIVDLNVMFDREGRTQVYHILHLETTDFNFSGMLQALSVIRQNKTMIELRNRLHSLSIIVTTSPAIAQFIDAMLSQANYGGRRLALFPTMETALEFIRFDQAQSQRVDTDLCSEEGA